MEIKNIGELLKKKPWKRLVSEDAEFPPMMYTMYYDVPVTYEPGLRYQYLSEFDLMKECCEASHEINSHYMSKRPIYEVGKRTVTEQVKDASGNPVYNADGTPKTITKDVKDWVIKGYEDVETVRSGLTRMIVEQKVSHLAKNGIEIANEGTDKKRFDNFRAWKDISGLDSAWMMLVKSALNCGDGAMYLYVNNGNIEYKVFSPLEGDMLFPHKDEKGNPMLVRKYVLNGKNAVDIYMTDYIETWVQATFEKDSGEDRKWWDSVKGWFKNISTKKSEDGWYRITRTPAQLDNMTCQVVYLRVPDTPVGHAMMNINAWERGASYISDKVRSTAFAKLFLKSAKIKNLPPLSSGEEVLGVENADADMLRASSAEYLTPPDISNIAGINLDNIEDAIMQSTMSIDLQPEILKSGADSSQTLKLLLRREIQWCHNAWPIVRPAAKQIIEVFKRLVAKIEQDDTYNKLKISVWNTPWMPVDEDAQADRATKLIYASVLSQESAREELNMQYTKEAEQINREQEEKIYRETYIKLKAEAQARKDFGELNTANDIVVTEGNTRTNNPDVNAKVDNNAPVRPLT